MLKIWRVCDMKLPIHAISAQMVPCYQVGIVGLTLEMSKDQVLRMLDEMAKQVTPEVLVEMLDSVLECAGVER